MTVVRTGCREQDRLGVKLQHRYNVARERLEIPGLHGTQAFTFSMRSPRPMSTSSCACMFSNISTHASHPPVYLETECFLLCTRTVQLFARLGARHFGTFGFGVFLEDEVCHGSLVELCGEDGTGKSALLHHMAVQCVLPKQVPGGGGGEVAFITTNCGVNVHMMVSMLQKYMLWDTS